MSITIGVNSGFVTTSPTSDPSDSTPILDFTAKTTHDTSPSTAVRITEVGWWCDTATQESNFEIGLYSDDGGNAENLLEVTRTNAKGTSAGWKTVAVDWTITGDTEYWIGVQLDDTSTATRTGNASIGGTGSASQSFRSTLPDPYPDSGINVDGKYAFYALWEEASTTTNPKIKISGTFSTKPIKVKIGGSFVEKTLKVKVGGTFQ